ncbi:anti-sigma factor [Cryobacterium melibiosiphilum]|uniref:Anti-sigma factor n=1 Tax=Cryobacterium melibiosiphilum TaxID=995039 RepID=A0A3A5MLQ2_9MICO|nr:anti-sigma factor [Cryobacterium melibiosiphilum]RJT88048.1 anti-sigma factor [Cryobacterium melibiosiphilum]
MAHIDPDDLALIALSGTGATDAPAGANVSSHLAECPDCARELAELRRTVDLGRTIPLDLLTPSPTVWAGIHAELGLSASVAAVPGPATAGPEAAGAVAPGPDALGPVAPRPGAPVPVVPGLGEPVGVLPILGDPGHSALGPVVAPIDAPVTALTDGRPARQHRLRWVPVAAAAAVGLAVGLSASLWWPAPREQLLAQGTLDPLPGWTASGEASVARSADGPREVTVTLSVGAPSATPGDEPLREVWLLTPDASGLVSLGLLTGDTGRFVVPDAVDLAEFSVVDVSAEASDGDPAHSGDSIVRGELVPRAVAS